MSHELSPDQANAQAVLLPFFKRRGEGLLTLGGYAGCGKTWLVADTVAKLDPRPRIAFCAFTGKAASVLKAKLAAAGALKESDYCGTVHGLIYTAHAAAPTGKPVPAVEEGEAPKKREPILKRTSAGIGFDLKDRIDCDFIVLDEASMMREDLFDDLRSFEKPILAVGDHGQLYPVGDRFSLMRNPDLRLEQIHRQAEGDPIIRLSVMAREEGRIPLGDWSSPGRTVRKTRDGSEISKVPELEKVLFLCGINATRVRYNAFVRERVGFLSHDPEPGEKVICLKNNRDEKIFNGMTGKILAIEPRGQHWYETEIQMEDETLYAGWIFKHQFGSLYPVHEYEGLESWKIGELFDWGYCMTTHKSQGSEADSVVLVEEKVGMMSDDDWRRWLYTAVTRSKKNLLIIGRGR